MLDVIAQFILGEGVGVGDDLVWYLGRGAAALGWWLVGAVLAERDGLVGPAGGAGAVQEGALDALSVLHVHRLHVLQPGLSGRLVLDCGATGQHPLDSTFAEGGVAHCPRIAFKDESESERGRFVGR